MFRKCEHNIWRVLEWIFILLMAVQIMFGIGWIVKNIRYEALFFETLSYLKSAETFIMDEYTGFLYLVLIRMAQGLESVLRIPYYIFLYILQMAAAFISFWCFISKRGWIKEKDRRGKIVKGFVTVYLVTFPMLLQLHMAVLPYSLVSSAALLLVSEGLYYMKNPHKISGAALIKLCGLWLLAYVLLPDYGWFGGVFTGGVFLYVLVMNRQWRMRIVLAFVSTILCFGVVAGATQTPGSMGRMQKTVGAAMVHRFVWPYFVRDSFFWEERILDTFEYYDLVEFSQAPEAVDYKFGPMLEEKYGKEEANRIYWNMAAISLEMGSKLTLTNIARDFLSNACPQAALQLLLENNDSSLSGWNYGRLQDHDPVAAKNYLDVSMTGWNAMCFLGILLLLWQSIETKRSNCINKSQADAERVPVRRKGNVVGFVVFISLGSVVVWYTMSRGMQDYKYMMPVVLFWLMPIVKGLLITKEKCCQSENSICEKDGKEG